LADDSRAGQHGAVERPTQSALPPPSRWLFAWLLAALALLAASLVELLFRFIATPLIAVGSDLLAALSAALPAAAAAPALSLLLLFVAAHPLRLERAGAASLAFLAAVDAVVRVLLAEAWLGAAEEARMEAALLPGLVYAGLLPSLATLFARVVLAGLVRLRMDSNAVRGATAAAAVTALAGIGLDLFRGEDRKVTGEPSAEAALRPDLLLVTIDTWRADHLSAHPRAVAPHLTPNIDALAQRGWLFTEARAHVPLTVPSHTSMLSGRAPWEHGVVTNGAPLPDGIPWLPETLRAHGYRTAAVVSGAVIQGSRGFARGFDFFHDDLREPPLVPDLVAARLLREIRGVAQPRVFRSESARAVARAGAFLDQSGTEQPIFLWVHLYDVHTPHTADESLVAPHEAAALEGLPEPCAYKDHPAPNAGPGPMPMPPPGGRRAAGSHGKAQAAVAQRRELEAERRCSQVDALRKRVAGYRAEVQIADAAVGELVAALERRGNLDRTAIIVTADHGESLTEHGSRMAHQFSAYEPVLRVPLLVVPQGGAARPLRSDALVQHRDLAASVLDLLGIPPDPSFDGMPWRRAVDEQQSPSLVASMVHIPFLLRPGRPPPRPDEGPDAPIRIAVRDGARSLIRSAGLPDELYDLRADPSQVHELLRESSIHLPSTAPDPTAAPAPPGVPPELAAAADAVRAQLGRVRRGRPDPAAEDRDPQLDALRALGYVE
jgi:arylsulfatase A-like enzyme